MIELLTHTVATVFFWGVWIYLPGMLIQQKLKLNTGHEISLILGICVLLPYIFFSRWLIPLVPSLLLYVVFFSCLFFFWRNIIKIRRPKIPVLVIVGIGTGCFVQAWPYISTFFHGVKALEFEVFASHDQAWHASLIQELIVNFPPQIPGFSGVVLKNYHYFYDLLVASQIKIFGGDVHLYIQAIYPVLFSLLFGFAVWRVSTLFTKNALMQTLVILFTYLGNNLSYILSLFGNAEWKSDTFLLDQPIIYLYNLQTVLSITLVLYLFVVIQLFIRSGYRLGIGMIIPLMLATLMNLKVYAFIVAGITFGIGMILEYFRVVGTKGKFGAFIRSVFFICSISLIITAGIYLLAFNRENNFIDINPGWILDQFFIRNILPYWKWLAGYKAMAELYQENWKLLFVQIFTLCLFLFGNLHLRLLGLMGTYDHTALRLIRYSAIISLLLVLVGNQASFAFNIIQFAPYAIVGLSILMWHNVVKIRMIGLRYLIIIFIILVSIPTTLKTVSQYSISKQVFVDQELVESLSILKKQQRGTVMTLGLKTRAPNIISAVTGFPSYYYDQDQLDVLQISSKTRREWLENISKKLCSLSPNEMYELKSTGVTYVLSSPSVQCIPGQIIYKNKSYTVYRVE